MKIAVKTFVEFTLDINEAKSLYSIILKCMSAGYSSKSDIIIASHEAKVAEKIIHCFEKAKVIST